MESAEYKKQYDEYLARAEKALSQACERYLPEGSDVCRAARYSLLGGGKRIRAVLVLAVCDMLHGNAEAAEQFAAAVEMLHCYSLIHDDLPCMDNDDMRRGKPSCHKAFGESTAMLAGDVLLTEAFEAVAGAPAPASVCVHAAQALGAGAGSRGMVYGQELDLKYEALAAAEEQLRLIHRHKTGALINAAIQMGGAAAQADEVQRKGAGSIRLWHRSRVPDRGRCAGRDQDRRAAGQAHWQRQRKRQNDLLSPCSALTVPCSWRKS